jgi:hypothetical protein
MTGYPGIGGCVLWPLHCQSKGTFAILFLGQPPQILVPQIFHSNATLGFQEMPIKTLMIPIQGGVDASLCHTRSKESSARLRNKAFLMVHLLL